MKKMVVVLVGIALVAILVVMTFTLVDVMGTVGPEPSAPQPPKVAAAPTSERVVPVSTSIPEPSPVSDTKETAAPEGPLVTITGTVRIEGGVPAVGATVTSMASLRTGLEEFSTATIDDGSYRLVSKDGFTISIKAELPGYGLATDVRYNPEYFQIMTNKEAARSLQIDLVLAPEALVAGRVVDEQGAPVAGALVSSTSAATIDIGTMKSLNGASRVEATANAVGEFALHGVRAEAVIVAASAEGYVPAMAHHTAPATGVELVLKRGGGSISGVVLHASTRERLSSATVTLQPALNQQVLLPKEFAESRKGTSDADGSFRFADLPEGQYRAWAMRESLRPIPRTQPEPPLALAAGQQMTGVEVLLYAGHTIMGQVVDESTGGPLEGVLVFAGGQAPGGEGTARPQSLTGADGHYRLTGVSGTMVPVEAEKKGYKIIKPQGRGFTQDYVKLVPEELEVTKDIKMSPALTISGRVEFQNGQPAATAKVSFVESMGMPATAEGTPVGAGGTFSIEVAPQSEGAIRAAVVGYPSAFSDPIKVRLDSVADVVIVVREAASAGGIVLTPDGNPAAGATVKATYSFQVGGGMGRIETAGEQKAGADGRFLLNGLPAGKVRFVATHDEHAQSEELELELKPAERREGLELKLQVPHFVGGIVVNTEDEPLTGANVSVHQPSGGFHKFARTDAQGRFFFDKVPGGKLSANVNHEGISKQFESLVLDDEDQKLVMGETDGATLIGTVIDAETREAVKDFTVKKLPSSGGKEPEINSVPGQFRWEGLKKGWYLAALIEAPGYAPYTISRVDIQAGEKEVRRTYAMGPGATVRGRVVDASSKAPLSGVTLELYRDRMRFPGNRNVPMATLRNNEDGTFEFTGVEAGELAINLIARGQDRQVNIDTEHGKVLDLGDVELGGGEVILVRLVDERTGAPLPGVAVDLYRGPRFVGELVGARSTDANGNALFEKNNEGELYVKLDSPSFYISFDRGSLVEGDALESGIKPKVVTIPIGSTLLRGTALKGGVPFVGRVSGYTRANGLNYSIAQGPNTSEEGKFELAGMAAANWTISFSDMERTSNASVPVTIPAVPQFEHTFELPAGQINVTVVDAEGKPVEGAEVTLTGSDGRVRPAMRPTQTDAQGLMVLRDVAEGTWQVNVVHAGKGRGAEEVVLGPDEKRDLRITLSSSGGTLVSAVYHYETTQPMKTAWTKLKDAQGKTFSHDAQRDDDGIMKIGNIPAGTYQVEVSAWDYSEARRTVEIKEGETTKIEDVIFPAGTLHWRILDKQRKPQVGMRYRVTPLDPASLQEPVEGRTDKDGDAYVRGVWPGNYRAEVDVNGRKYEITVTLEKLGTNRVDTTVE